MDSCKDHYITQCQVLVLETVFEKTEFVPNGVLGGVVVRRRFGVLEGYCRSLGGGHV
jgi:hypothetical protein